MGRRIIPAMLSSSPIMMLPGQCHTLNTDDDDDEDDNGYDGGDDNDDKKDDDNDDLCSWRAAKENCSSQGGFLASIHSQVPMRLPSHRHFDDDHHCHPGHRHHLLCLSSTKLKIGLTGSSFLSLSKSNLTSDLISHWLIH